MKKLSLLNLTLFLLWCCSCSSDDSFRFQLSSSDSGIRQSVVSLELKGNAEKTPVLYRKGFCSKTEIPVQIETREDGSRHLYWIHDNDASSRTGYLLKMVDRPAAVPDLMTIEDDGSSLVLKRGNNRILDYHYKTVPLIEDYDTCFYRSGFIHPAWSPKGNVLTRIQPADHPHHYGIFMPWTKLEYNGKIYDLWNLGKRQGTVRAGTVLNKEEGPVFSRCSMALEHYTFDKDKKGRIQKETRIMDETWSIKAYALEDYFMWDFESTLSPCTLLPVLLKVYNYGGFGWRITEDWKPKACNMVTSEGDGIQNAFGKRARWIYTEGRSKNGTVSGFLLMSNPDNYNHPEPLSIWKTQVFVNFMPTMNKDWNLEPGKEYRLKYRVITYDGRLTPEKAEKLWQEYIHPKQINL